MVVGGDDPVIENVKKEHVGSAAAIYMLLQYQRNKAAVVVEKAVDPIFIFLVWLISESEKAESVTAQLSNYSPVALQPEIIGPALYVCWSGYKYLSSNEPNRLSWGPYMLRSLYELVAVALVMAVTVLLRS